MPTLNAIEIETSPNPSASVIWLHGLGANGHDFEPIVPELRLPSELGIRFIFPHAPSRPVTINGGMTMPSWYDIVSREIERVIDTEQLEMSAQQAGEFVEQELARGIDSKRIILAGFSQGGAVAYQLALSYPKPLGGLIALSTYFATHDSIQYDNANQQLPIFIGHGSVDTVVPEQLGQAAKALLQQKNYNMHYKSYPMDHSVCMEEVNDISNFLQIALSTDNHQGDQE